MSEVFFVIKTLLVTVAIVFLLQIKIGRTTVEQRSLTWMRQSSAIEAMRGVANGAVAAAGDGYEWARGAYENHFGSKDKKVRRAKWHEEAKRAESQNEDVD